MKYPTKPLYVAHNAMNARVCDRRLSSLQPILDHITTTTRELPPLLALGMRPRVIPTVDYSLSARDRYCIPTSFNIVCTFSLAECLAACLSDWLAGCLLGITHAPPGTSPNYFPRTTRHKRLLLQWPTQMAKHV